MFFSVSVIYVEFWSQYSFYYKQLANTAYQNLPSRVFESRLQRRDGHAGGRDDGKS